SKEDLVKCTVFLADIRDYDAMNAVYADFFEGTDPPARSAIGVAGLPAGARVEVECMAAAG
ncbi:MAG: RidA family protein, partial [Longimicrobiales bacterium]